jgi:hypothetical protein
MSGERGGRPEETSSESGALWITVVVPDAAPVVYPQAARVLLRIVVRLAEVEHGSDDTSKAEETAS